MNIDDLGIGAGGGLITALFTWLGFKQRLDRADADIKELKKDVMYRDVHEVCAGAHKDQLVDMNKKLDRILDRLEAQ